MTASVQSIGMGRVARGSAANLVGAAVSACSAFALTVVVTRGLSRSEAGVFFSISSLFLLGTSLGQLGTDTGLVYFLSRCRVLGKVDQIRHYLRAAVRPVLGTALVMAAAMLLFAPELARMTNPAHAEQATWYLRVLALFIPLAALENVALAATRGLGSMRPNAVVEQLGRPTVQLLLVVLAVSTSGTDWLMWAWAGAYLPAAAVGWWWWVRMRRHLSPRTLPAQAGVAREFWKFTGPRSVASVAQLVMQRLDIVLVGAMAGAVEAAVYAAATRFIVAGQMGRNAVALAAQPSLAEALARDDHQRAKQVFQVSAGWLMMVTWPLFLLFSVLGEPILHVFGGGYESGTVVLLVISLSMLVATGCGDVDSVLIMAGRTSWSLANMLVALAINLTLDLWLIPELGMLGAAIGWAAAIVTKNVMALVQVAVAFRLHPFGRVSATVAGLSLTSFALVPWLVRLASGPNWQSVAISVSVGGVVYLAGLWFLRVVLALDSLRALRRRSPAAERQG